jgi:hypothetical protein
MQRRNEREKPFTFASLALLKAKLYGRELENIAEFCATRIASIASVDWTSEKEVGPMSSPEGRIFSSWKEIAAFLGRGVRTVQRWETTLGLPIRRPNGYGSNVVVASESELRQWLRQAGPRSPTHQTATDAAIIQKIAEKLDAVEQENQRLQQMLSRMEARFEQIENALDPRFNGNGRSRRAKRPSPYKIQTSSENGGDSSSGAA